MLTYHPKLMFSSKVIIAITNRIVYQKEIMRILITPQLLFFYAFVNGCDKITSMHTHASHTVLVVDDTPVNLRLLCSILHGANFRVLTAGGSEEALQLIETQTPDIILLDAMMPGMDGFALCRKLKQDDKYSDIPLIFITSLSQQEDIVEGFNAGANDYIVKPFNRQELLARVRNHLHLYDMLKENKRLIELSEAASRSKTEFLASMSHEIRTPLNSIIGMAEVLTDTKLTAEQQNFVRIFRSAGESLLAIINDILDLSKIEAGQIEADNIDFHLPSLLDSVHSILSVRAVEQNVNISITIHPDVPTGLLGDPTRLRQILINLVGNGLKFAKNGTVKILVKKSSDKQLFFSVTDDGIGIPKEKQEIIFDSFTQADSLTTRRYGGTGLGLTICRKLTKILGGEIGLESSPGQGSCFFFTCNLQPALTDVTPSTEESIPASTCKVLKAAQILLVDDNEDNRNLLCLYLRNTPFTLHTTNNGRDALELFQNSSFDLVFMDLEMPIMDGYEATKRFREWEQKQQLKETPIVALTAHAFVRFKKKCLAAGCTEYLTKPIRRDTLIQCIVSHLKENGDSSKSTEKNTPPPKNSSSQVTIDCKIKKLIPPFLKNKREDARQLLQTIDDNNFTLLKQQAHTIKGTSWMYGFQFLGDLCLTLEQAAMDDDKEMAKSIAEQIKQHLDEVEITYTKTR